MSCVLFTNEGSSSDCRMWTQTLQHLYGITLAVMSNAILHVVIARAFFTPYNNYIWNKKYTVIDPYPKYNIFSSCESYKDSELEVNHFLLCFIERAMFWIWIFYFPLNFHYCTYSILRILFVPPRLWFPFTIKDLSLKNISSFYFFTDCLQTPFAIVSSK